MGSLGLLVNDAVTLSFCHAVTGPLGLLVNDCRPVALPCSLCPRAASRRRCRADCFSTALSLCRLVVLSCSLCPRRCRLVLLSWGPRGCSSMAKAMTLSRCCPVMQSCSFFSPGLLVDGAVALSPRRAVVGPPRLLVNVAVTPLRAQLLCLDAAPSWGVGRRAPSQKVPAFGKGLRLPAALFDWGAFMRSDPCLGPAGQWHCGSNPNPCCAPLSRWARITL